MKRTAILMVFHLASVACSSSSSGSMAKQSDTRSAAITLYDVHHSMIAQLSPDGTVTDGASRLVTHYDASTRSMLLLGATLDVADSVHVTGARELDVHVGALGPWHVRVLPSNEVEVDGQSFGFVNGIDISEAGMFRLGILLCVVPVVNPPPLPPVDADRRAHARVLTPGQ